MTPPRDYHREAWSNPPAAETDHTWDRDACPGCAFVAGIEQEAVAAERARLRAAVWAMDALQYDDASEPLLRKTTVLALLEPGDG